MLLCKYCFSTKSTTWFGKCVCRCHLYTGRWFKHIVEPTAQFELPRPGPFSLSTIRRPQSGFDKNTKKLQVLSETSVCKYKASWAKGLFFLFKGFVAFWEVWYLIHSNRRLRCKYTHSKNSEGLNIEGDERRDSDPHYFGHYTGIVGVTPLLWPMQ